MPCREMVTMSARALLCLFLSIFLTCPWSCLAFQQRQNPKFTTGSRRHSHEFTTVAESSLCSTVDINWYQFAVQGAVAGGCRALSRGLTFPFDTLKTLEQTGTPSTDKNDGSEITQEVIVSKLKTLLSKEYFSGIFPAVASAVPANAVFFVVYNYFQTIAASDCVLHYFSVADTDFYQGASVLFIERLLFSAVATLPQNAIKIPAELIKQRAQVQPNTNLLALLQQAIRPPFGIRGLYQGGGAQLIREIPYNAIQMATFQLFKESLASSSIVSPFGLGSASISGVLGLVAAAIAAVLTQPADVIKTKVMTATEENYTSEDGQQNHLITEESYGIIKTAKNIYANEGLNGFFVGLTPRLILVSLGGMVYFWAAEVSSEFLGISLSK